jgi:hypothetical protein
VPWLKPLDSYDRRECCEFQVAIRLRANRTAGFPRTPPFPLRFSVASFSCAAGFPRLEICCSKLELPARKTVVNYNGFPRRDARSPVETFNTSVRKLSKARAILVGGWEWE